MTTIAAIARDGVVWMAADRRAAVGGLVWTGRTPKITRLGQPDREGGRRPDALIGSSGRSAGGSLARYRVSLPKAPDPDRVDRCDAWADAVVRRLARAAARAEPAILDEDRDVPFSALLAYAGHLWVLGDQHAQEITGGVAAIGSGAELALGSLSATLRRGVRPVAALTEAVETAGLHDPWTGDGVDVEHLPHP